VVPALAFQAKKIIHLPETPAWFAIGKPLQLFLDLAIILFKGRIAINTSADIQDAASLAFTKIVIFKSIPGEFTPLSSL
jgi:hypothetical protein